MIGDSDWTRVDSIPVAERFGENPLIVSVWCYLCLLEIELCGIFRCACVKKLSGEICSSGIKVLFEFYCGAFFIFMCFLTINTSFGVAELNRGETELVEKRCVRVSGVRTCRLS